MIRVYFESTNHLYAEEVARFIDEGTYCLCIAALEKEAAERYMMVTDSVTKAEFKEI